MLSICRTALYFFTKVPLYLLHPALYAFQTRVTHVTANQITLQQTIIHPQGGGQPSDDAHIMLKNGAIFPVLRSISPYVCEIKGVVQTNERVTVVVDELMRIAHSKLHSGGHLIDLAVERSGLKWSPTKAYHFPDNPYVEYTAKVDNQQLQAIKLSLNQCLEELLRTNIPVESKIYSIEEAKQKHLIDNQFKGEFVRTINIAENSCLCAGTHVQNIQNLGRVFIPKISSKKGKIKVYYQI